jgi:hypothetical protein
MLDPQGRLKGCDLSDSVGTVQVVLVRTAVEAPSQCTSSVRNVEVVSEVLIVTVYPVMGEPPVGGAVHESTTFNPLITVCGRSGGSGICAARIGTGVE